MDAYYFKFMIRNVTDSYDVEDYQAAIRAHLVYSQSYQAVSWKDGGAVFRKS